MGILRGRHEKLAKNFSRLERISASGMRNATSPELGKMLAGRLSIDAEAMVSRARVLAGHSRRELSTQQRQLALVLVTTVTVLALAVPVGSWVVIQGVLKPLKTLQTGTETLGGGNLGHRICTATRDEFGQVAHAFNRMAENLTASRDELEKEVAERKCAEAVLSQQTEDLVRSNEELDRFAYVASHDLKAPLRAIDQLASFIAEDAGERLGEASRGDLNLMRERVHRMERLLDDLLAYSRIGRKESRAVDVNSADVVAEVVNLLSPRPGFEVVADPDLPMVRAPRVAVELVFRNLIGNALKHHDRETGKVHVSYRGTDGRVEFAIHDDGPGIPAEFSEQVFEMFHTLKPRDVMEGSGMGLATVKKSLESSGGSIRLDPNQGRGTTFRITWPAASQSDTCN